MFAALADNIENMADKISVFFAFAPVARLKYLRQDFLSSAAKDIDSIAWWLDTLKIYELFGEEWQKA